MRWLSNSHGVVGNFWWWTASWQRGQSRGLGFCSYRPLFIPRCQNLYGSQLVNPSRSFPFCLQASLLRPGQCLSHGRSTVPQLLKEREADPGHKQSAHRGSWRAWRGWPRAPLEGTQQRPGEANGPAPALQPQLDHRPCLHRKDFLKALSERPKRRKDLLFWSRVRIITILGLKFFRNQFGFKRKRYCVYVSLHTNVVNSLNRQAQCNGWHDDREEKCALRNVFSLFFFSSSSV